MKVSKSIRTLVLALVLVLLSVTPVLANQSMVVNVDGKKLNLDVNPVIIEGRALVPIRAVAEQLGGEVSYDASKQVVEIVTVDNTVKLTVNSKVADVNGKSVTLDVPAQIINSRTLVPLRFVSESLGAEVNYDSKNHVANIKYFSDMKGTLKIGGSTTLQPISQMAADKLMAMNSGLSISVAGGGSGEGIKGAASGAFNIGNISKDLSDTDKKDYPGLMNYKIGLDGIAVIMNPNNKVAELSKQQVIDIFTGKIKNWKEVGGADSAIFLQTREPGSGTLDGFETLALKKAKVAATATPHTSNGLIKEAIAKNTNAIGFLSLGYIDGSVKTPKIEGVSCLKSKAVTHEWPYVRNLNVVTKGTPSGLTAKFINYLRSPEGQSIVSIDYLALKAQD